MAAVRAKQIERVCAICCALAVKLLAASSQRAARAWMMSSGAYESNVRDMLMAPGIHTPEGRATSIAQKLRFAEIEPPKVCPYR